MTPHVKFRSLEKNFPESVLKYRKNSTAERRRTAATRSFRSSEDVYKTLRPRKVFRPYYVLWLLFQVQHLNLENFSICFVVPYKVWLDHCIKFTDTGLYSDFKKKKKYWFWNIRFRNFCFRKLWFYISLPSCIALENKCIEFYTQLQI